MSIPSLSFFFSTPSIFRARLVPVPKIEEVPTTVADNIAYLIWIQYPIDYGCPYTLIISSTTSDALADGIGTSITVFGSLEYGRDTVR